MISEIDEDSEPPNDTTLVVANRTASSRELAGRLAEIAASGGGEHLFIVVVPALGGDGRAAAAARAHLDAVARPACARPGLSSPASSATPTPSRRR